MRVASKKFIIINLVVLMLFVACAVWAIGRLDWRSVGHNLAAASPSQVALMAAAWMAALFVRPLRLLILIRSMAPEVERRYWPVWCADLIAMAMNSLIPVRAGDMAMALVLRQGLGLRTARGFSAVLVDRFFDLLTVVAMFVAALSAAPSVAPWAARATITIPLVVGAMAVGLWLVIRMRAFWVDLLDKMLLRCAPSHRQKWGERVHDLFDGLVVINRPEVMVPVLGLSVVLWGVMATSYWFGARAVWPDTPFAAGAFTAGAIALSFAVPTPPGGVGVFHAVTIVALSLFGLPIEVALACAILCHALQLGSVLILAAVALVVQGVSIRSLTELHRTRP